MSALRIALINTFYPPFNFGGDGVYVRRLAHSLARLGCEVHVLHDTETYKALARKSLGPLAPLEEPAGVRVHALESPLGALAPLITQQTGRPLAHGAALDTFFALNFDVTHFHNVSALGGPGILSRGAGVKLYTAHEHWLVCPTHILWKRNREICEKRECLSCQLSYRRPPQLWRHTPFLRQQAEHIDAFIALSQSSADNHARFGFSREMRVLPSFLPNEEGVRDAKVVRDKPYALFVGRLEVLKGLQDVIPAFRAHEDVELLIVGDGDYGDQLRELAAGAPNIHFLGRKAPDEVEAYYAGATAVILPSVCLEVFPLVALEAFRAGAPIIARNCGPFPEIIEKSGAGVIFNSAEEIGPAVMRFAGDAVLRDEFGRRAKLAFSEHWSETVAIGAYLNLIGEIAISRGFDEIAEKTAIAAQRLARPA